MLEGKGLLLADDLVETDAGLEVRLLLGEGHDGAVSAAAAELALPEQLGREADGVVEGQLDTGKGRCQCRGDGDQWSD